MRWDSLGSPYSYDLPHRPPARLPFRKFGHRARHASLVDDREAH